MAYTLEERETIVRYDEMDIEKELENDFCIYVRAKLSDLIFSVGKTPLISPPNCEIFLIYFCIVNLFSKAFVKTSE